MINIPMEGVTTQFNNFLNSPIVAGSGQWIVGIAIGSFAFYALLQAVRK